MRRVRFDKQGCHCCRREFLQAMGATATRLKIGDIDETKPVAPSAVAATFQVKLKAGRTGFQTWLTDAETGKARGAYFAYVKRV